MLKKENTIFDNSDKNNKKEEIKGEAKKEIEKLEQLIKSSSVLLNISTVFPFDLFPDNIVIDKEKVNIIYREFFGSGQVQSILIKDINSLDMESSIFFATLRMTIRGDPQHQILIRYLKRDDAIQARKIIQGLITSDREGVELEKIPDGDLARKLEELGETREKLE